MNANSSHMLTDSPYNLFWMGHAGIVGEAHEQVKQHVLDLGFRKCFHDFRFLSSQPGQESAAMTLNTLKPLKVVEPV